MLSCWHVLHEALITSEPACLLVPCKDSRFRDADTLRKPLCRGCCQLFLLDPALSSYKLTTHWNGLHQRRSISYGEIRRMSQHAHATGLGFEVLALQKLAKSCRRRIKPSLRRDELQCNSCNWASTKYVNLNAWHNACFVHELCSKWAREARHAHEFTQPAWSLWRP